MKLADTILKNFQQNKYLEMLPDFQEKKTQAFITLTLTLIALSIFGFFAISPTLSIIAQLQKQLEDSIFVNQKLEEKIKNLAILQQKYNLLQNDLTIVLSAVPKTPTVPLLVGQIHALANAHAIVLSRIQVFEVDLSKTQTPKNYSSFAFILEGEGTYAQIADFTQDLAHFERIVTIDSFTIAAGLDPNDKQKLSLRGKAHFKN